jgi:CRISPR-associated protein Csx10
MEDGRRSLPTPLALLRRKGDSEDNAPAYNATHSEFDREKAAGDDTLKSVGAPFCLIGNDELTLCGPQPNRLTVHVAREPKKGRATADGGAIFQYEALSAGQWFGGVVLASSAADAVIIRDLLNGPAWLGRSRSAGYGQVRIELDDDPPDSWREASGEVPDLPAEEPVTLTLLSDAILRDRQGAYALVLDQTILEAYLGVKIKQLYPERSFSATTLSGGFNRTAQTPLAQSYSLATGSTVTFELVDALNAVAVGRLEAEGIGERRAEGYGRITFGWLAEERLTTVKGVPYRVRTRAGALTTASQAMARQMARRLLDLEVQQRIARFTRDYVEPLALQMPANSQLGRVRVLLRRAARNGAPLGTVRQSLGAFQAAGRQQFERARITEANIPLWDWLIGLLAEPPALDVWEQLKIPRHAWPTVAGERAVDDQVLNRTVTLKLIEAVLTAAARERKQREDAR